MAHDREDPLAAAPPSPEPRPTPAADTPRVLRSEKLSSLGFLHGFSTRDGGVSAGPYAQMNLGRSVGDDPALVEENHQRLARAVGYAREKLFEASQTHGTAVLEPSERDEPSALRAREADALVAREKGLAVGVRTADCAPILIADVRTGAVAAVHAGWRGVVAGVISEALRVLAARSPSDLIAVVGPSIGPCCFQVGDDVAARLAQAGGDGIVLRRGLERPHVDLWQAVGHQLRLAGVHAPEVMGLCTVCHPERFFSYRRDGQQSGRMLSLIVARGAA